MTTTTIFPVPPTRRDPAPRPSAALVASLPTGGIPDDLVAYKAARAAGERDRHAAALAAVHHE